MAENGIELAKAYVQIVPSAQGIKGSLEEAMGSASEEAGKTGGAKLASGIGSAMGKIAKVTAAGLAVAGAGVASLTKSAVDSYAEYEQLSGGVETLFQGSADTIKKYAEEAYSTAGLSANQYMETVTGFSASLIQATGRGEQQDIDQLSAELDEAYKAAKRGYEDQYDAAKSSWDDRLKLAKQAKASNLAELQSQRDEELKALKRSNEDQLEALKAANKDRIAAAEEANNASIVTEESLARAAIAANRAVIDMSDNANKMGTDIGSIQNAYQGFAKQNYTMLDNLKLGYGGTQAEMARLIGDASKLTDVQAELGVTVDANSMSFDNIVNAISVVQKSMGIMGATADEALYTIEGSMSSAKAAWTNLVTAIGRGEDISESVDALMMSVFGGENGGGLLNNILPRVQTILESIGKYLPVAAPQFISGIADLVVKLMPSLMDSAASVFQGLVDGLLAVLPTIIQYLPQMLQTFIDLVLQIADGIIQALPNIVATIAAALPEILPQLINGIVALFVMLCENFRNIIDPIIQALPDIINSITDALISNLPLIIAGIFMLIGGIIAELPSLLIGIWKTITHFFSEVWNQWFGPALEKVGGFFAGIWDKVVDFYSPLIDWIKGVWEKIVQGFHTVIDPWIEIFKRAFLAIKTTVIDPITRWFSDMWAKISGFASKAWEGIKNVFQPVADWFKNIFSKAWQAVKNVFSAGGKVFDGIKDGIVNAFKTVVNAIIRGINKIIPIPFNAINGILQRIHNIKILGVSPFTWVGTLAVPQIPELATGGVLERGQVGLLEGTGAEAVVPLERNTGWIKRVAAEMAVAGPDSYMDAADEIIDALHGLRVYLDGDRLVGGITGDMDKSLGGRSIMAGRGVATA